MNIFLENLVKTNRTAEYYFNMPDILEIKRMKKDIDKLNELIGNKNFDNTLKNILVETPSIIKMIPLLIAYREENLDLLMEYSYDKPWVVSTYSFKLKNIDEERILSIIDFFEKIGLKKFFMDKEINDVYSFILGTHLGLRASARKNKSGDFMESYVNTYISNMCTNNNLEYISQATADEILTSFNIDIKDILKNRRPDFVINNNGKLLLIEVNFYNSTGSKIKSTANEYIKLNGELKNCLEIQDFIWITDGPAWKKEKKTLERVFENIENIINIHDMNNGYIENKLK